MRGNPLTCYIRNAVTHLAPVCAHPNLKITSALPNEVPMWAQMIENSAVRLQRDTHDASHHEPRQEQESNMEPAVHQNAQSNNPQPFLVHSTSHWAKQNHQARKYVEADRTHPEPSIAGTPTRLVVLPLHPFNHLTVPHVTAKNLSQHKSRYDSTRTT